jgi:uncharacterized glyoxalase superfamily protein PhnB
MIRTNHPQFSEDPMPTLARIAPEVPARDLMDSIRYYEERLGFRLVMQLPVGAYAIVERDAVAVHLFESAPDAATPIAFHIFVPELDELFEELKSRGASLLTNIQTRPWGNRDFRAADPFGNELKFTQPLNR